MKAFKRKGGRFVARLDEIEREVVAQLAADVAELLGATPAQLTAAVGFEARPDDGTSDPADDDAPAPRGGCDPWELPLQGPDDLLARLTGQMAAPTSSHGPAGLDAGMTLGAPTLDEPDDPAVRRLLPTASEEPEIAAEFRRFAHVDLRATKIERLLALVRALRRADAHDGRLAVPVERADLLAGALVDIRLVLAERLGLHDDESADALYEDLAAASHDGPDGPRMGELSGTAAALRLHLGSAYAALTWWQESLVTVQLSALDDPDA